MIAFATVALLTLSAPAMPPAKASRAPAAADPEITARHFVEEFAAKHFATAGSAFSDQMKGAMPPDKLQVLWQGLENQNGAFQKIGTTSSEPVGDGIAELLTCGFARGPVTLEVYIDAQKHIGGIFLSPASLIARRFVNLLGKDDFAGAEAMLTPAARQSLPLAKLTALWKDMVAEAGKFDALQRTKVESAGGNWAAVARVSFEKKTIDLRVGVDGEARITDFVRQ